MEGDKQPAKATDQDSSWVFKPGTATPPLAQSSPAPTAQHSEVNHHETEQESVEWTASEFIAHQKGVLWYLFLVVVAAIVAALAYWLTKDEITAAVILVAGLVFGVAAGRKPRIIGYRLDESGITIGQKTYPYAVFKSFTVVDEGVFSSITLLPVKRFMPAYNIYYAPDDEDEIMEVLTHYLPYEQRKESLLDSIVHRIRF